MAIYYCSRTDVTDLLPSLVGSDVSTTAQQDTKLRLQAKLWIDSVYPDKAPFDPVPDNDPKDWAVSQANHNSGDSSVTISGGSGDPAEGDLFRVTLDRQWNREADDVNPDLDDSRVYRVTAYAGGTLSYEPTARHDFPQNAPIHFGTPGLVRRAAALYAVHIAYQIIRENPLDKEALLVLKQAQQLLQIPEGGFLAKAQVESTSDQPSGGVVVVRRA